MVIGNCYGVEAGVVEREGPEVEVGGHKLDNENGHLIGGRNFLNLS